MTGSDALAPVVAAFVDGVTDDLVDAASGLAGADRAQLRADVVNEAFNLCVAVIDVDGRLGDDELWALSATFGPLLPDRRIAGATPDQLRESDLVRGRAEWLSRPSTMFDILATADGRDGGSRAVRYAQRASDVGLLIAALDSYPSTVEIRAVGAHRSMLLEHVHAVVPGGPATIPDTADPAGPPSPPPVDDPPRPIEELMAELDSLIGLADVKAEVHLVADLLTVQRLRRERNLPVIDTSLHLVFVGNPGTGKTTVARLLAQIYRSLGALSRGHLVETDRSGLVAGYVGQTAPLVVKRFDEADGGMLFIDEAYTLAQGGEDDFGREAIDQMVKLMEDRRDRIAVVIAGYPAEMENLIATNPGLESRFPKTIVFPDYSTDELVSIFRGICDKQKYELDEAGEDRLRAALDRAPRDKGFGNGRLARNLFEAAVSRHATRVARLEAPTDEDLQRFHPDDLAPAPVGAGGDTPQVPSAP